MFQTLESYLADRVGRVVLISLVLVAGISTLVGLAIDAWAFQGKDFVGNLLAEVVGNAVSILVGLLIVDWFLEYRKKQQWTRVRDFTLRAITAHLYETAVALFLHFPGFDYNVIAPINEGNRDTPNSTTLAGFEKLSKELPNLPDLFVESPQRRPDKSISDYAVDFYEDVKWDLDQIQAVLTPRVMLGPTADAQALVDALVEFDNARRNLHHSIIGHKLVLTGGVFEKACLLMESAERVYRAVYELWQAS